MESQYNEAKKRQERSPEKKKDKRGGNALLVEDSKKNKKQRERNKKESEKLQERRGLGYRRFPWKRRLQKKTRKVTSPGSEERTNRKESLQKTHCQSSPKHWQGRGRTYTPKMGGAPKPQKKPDTEWKAAKNQSEHASR